MRLEGIHHVTCITGDAPGNVEFYAGILGLRMVKKTVNQDDPTVYHLFYADEQGSPGRGHHVLRVPGRAAGRAGDGMVHTVSWRVASEAALDFWEQRLADHEVAVTRADGRLAFADPEGLRLELVVREATDAPLIAEHPEIPAEVALQGFDGVRAFASPARSEPIPLLESHARLHRRSATRRGRSAARTRGGRFYGYDAAACRSRASAVRAPCTTSRSRRRWTSTAPGSQAVVGAGGHAPEPDHRPLLVPVDLLPRAERRAVRDRDARPRLLGRRGSRAPRRVADPAARVRAPARAGRAGSDAAARPACSWARRRWR